MHGLGHKRRAPTQLHFGSAQRSTAASNAIANLLAAYGSFSNGKLNTNGAVNSWPTSFMIVQNIPATATTPACSSTFVQPVGSPVTTVNTYGQINSYKFTFNYTLCSIGTSSALQRATVSENGNITVLIQAPPNNLNQSYSYYGAFIDNYNPCQQGALVPGIFEGPAFTNGAWGFMNSGAYTFTGPVGQAGAMADYWTGGTCTPSATTPSGLISTSRVAHWRWVSKQSTPNRLLQPEICGA